MTLDSLLTRALISRYEQRTWFAGCTLEKTIILCPDRQLCESLTRCWLPQIQRVLPDCTVRVGQKAEPVKAAYRGHHQEPVARRLDTL